MTDEYCCDEMRRLNIEGIGGNYTVYWDTKTLTVFGTFEGEDYEIEPFKMKYCMFCGAELK